MSTQTEQLEHEAEAARQRLSATVDELRSRLTPGHALDEIIGYGRDGAAGEFVRNLGRDIARNPLPVTLAGAGLAWLMLARNGSSNGTAYGNSRGNGHALGTVQSSVSGARAGLTAAGETMSEAADDFTDGVLEGTATAADYVSSGARAAASGISGMAASARDTTAATYRAASERAQGLRAAVGDGSRHAAGRMSDIGRSVADLCREQPLVLAGIGIAFGALLGAVLPRTETEDRLVGRTSDEVKNEGAALASESYETARDAVRHAEVGGEGEGEGEEAYAGAQRERVAASTGRIPTGDETGLT